MVLRFFMFAVAFLLSCTEFERGNPYDAKGKGIKKEVSWEQDPEVEEVKFKFTDPRDKKNYDAVEFRITRDGNSKSGIARIDSNITWMAQNLNWDAPGSVCYDNDETKCAIYGRLYDFETAKTACPSGWRLPIDGEEKLVTYEVVVCNERNDCNKATEDILSGNIYEVLGYERCYKTEERYTGSGQTYVWCVGRWIGLGGIGYSNDNFSDIDNVGYWWTSKDGKAGNAYYIYGHINGNEYGELEKSLTDKNNFLSVRCVRD